MRETHTVRVWVIATVRKEAGLDTDHLDDVYSIVGNLVRIAAVVELGEIAAACEESKAAPLKVMLLDPRRLPCSAEDHMRNRQLLEAFAQFRWDIEVIRRGICASDASARKDA